MTEGLTRRTVLQAGFAAGIAIPLLAACSASGSSSAGSGSATVRFSSYGDPTKLGLRSSLAKEYMAAHPKVKMVFEGSATADYWDKLATEIAGGNAPDVINIDSVHIAEYASKNALMALDKYIPKPIETDTFTKTLVNLGQLNGKQYGVPVATSMYAWGYDQTVLDSLGIPLPDGSWTWDSYAVLANDIREASKKTIYGSEDPSGDEATLQIWLRTKGAELYHGGQLAYSQANLEEWFNYWASLRASGGIVPADVASLSKYGDWPNSPMVTKKAPLGHIFTPNLAGGFQGLTKNTLNLALPPVDKAGDKTATFANASSYLSINTRASDPAAAAEFINWFVNGKEAALSLRLISGPPASSAGMDALLQSADLTDAEKAVLDFTKMALGQVQSTPEPSSGGDVEVQALLLKVSQDIAFKKASVAEASKQFFSDAAKALSQ